MLIGLLLLSSTFASAQPQIQGQAPRRLDERGNTRALYNIASRQYKGAPELAARTFLTEHPTFTKIEGRGSTLRISRVDAAERGTHVRFIQEYQGIPVYRGAVVVSLNENQEVGFVLNTTRENPDPPELVPRFDAEKAISLAHQHLLSVSPALAGSERADLVVFRRPDGTDRLAYKVSMLLREPAGDWEVIVDASTGAELQRLDRFVNGGNESSYARGTGRVYLLNPLSAARALYGQPGFTNNNGADTDSLTYYRALVPLDSLLFEGGLYKLVGPSCRVTNLEDPYDPEYYAEPNPDGFHYTRSQSGFEAVMAYYHISTAYRRFAQLGFTSNTLRAVRVDPHGCYGMDNSRYSPGSNFISLGTGGINDAEDAEVIWHEYGHAIQYNIIPDWGGGECLILGEGFGDYWAGSYARSMNQWHETDPQYQWVFGWDGHNPLYWSGRILDDPRTYPFPEGSVHLAGQIWSSALMSIRKDLGGDVTDRLVVKSLYYLGPEATAMDNAYAILQADRDLYGGAHLPTLMYWLCTVKHFIPAGTGGSVLIVSDEIPSATASPRPTDKDDAGDPPEGPAKTVAGQFASLGVLQGVDVGATTFDSFDPSVLTTTKVLVLLGGVNTTPFDDSTKRMAVRDFVQRGGKVLVTGGEVGYYYRSQAAGAEVDETFRREVLHSAAFLGDALGGSLTACTPDEPIFMQPHHITTPVEFTNRSLYVDRDAVEPEPGDTRALGRWSCLSRSGALIASFGQDGNVKTLFLPFSFGSLADSTTSAALMENALSYLLYYRNTSTDAGTSNAEFPETFALEQNYPNPFNPATTIRFTIGGTEGQGPGARNVKLVVYDLIGREVAVLVNETKSPGSYEVRFDASTLASGVYAYRLITGQFVQTRKMAYLR